MIGGVTALTPIKDETTPKMNPPDTRITDSRLWLRTAKKPSGRESNQKRAQYYQIVCSYTLARWRDDHLVVDIVFTHNHRETWWSRSGSNRRPLECHYSQPFQGFLFLEEISSVFDRWKPAVFSFLASFIPEDSDKI